LAVLPRMNEVFIYEKRTHVDKVISPEDLIPLFQSADGTNPNADSRSKAVSSLKGFERKLGYMSALVKIWTQHPNDFLRHVAVISLKNNASFFFSDKASRTLEFCDKYVEEERAFVRTKLLEGFKTETSMPLVKQLAISLAKIAKYDWFHDQTDIVIQCLRFLESAEPGLIHKGALLAFEIFSELSTLKIVRNAVHYKQISSASWKTLYGLWKQCSQQIFQVFEQMSSSQMQLRDKLDELLIVMKYLNGSLQKLFTFGSCKKSLLDDQPEKALFISDLAEILQIFGIQVYQKLDDSSEWRSIKSCLGEILIDSTQTILSVHKQNPYGFVQFLPIYISFITSLIEKPDAPCFLVHFALSFMEQIVGCRAYFSSAKKKLRRDTIPYYEKVRSFMTQTFTSEVVIKLVETVMMNFFLFTDRDTNHWRSTPESFYQESCGGHISNDCHRESACSLCTTLVRKYRKRLGSRVISMFQSNLQQDLRSADDVRIRESVYHFFGLAYPFLSDSLEEQGFNVLAFYNNYLQGDIRSDHILLTARGLWFLPFIKNAIFTNDEAILSFFNLMSETIMNNNDVMIRLTCINTLKEYLEHPEFQYIHVEPYTIDLIRALMRFLTELELLENITSVILSLALLIDKSKQNHSLLSEADNIMEYAKNMWASCPSNVIRASILSFFTSLVRALRENCTNHLSTLIPILWTVTNAKTQDTYLVESGFDLWHEVLKNISCMNDDILKLFAHNLHFFVETRGAPKETCLQIFKSYLLLDSKAVMAEYQDQIQDLVPYLLEYMNKDGATHVCHVLGIFLHIFPDKGSIFMQDILGEMLVNTVDMCEPFNLNELLQYFNTLARLFFTNWNNGLLLIQATETKKRRSLLTSFLMRWINYIDRVHLPHLLKLNVIALSKFCSIPLPTEINVEQLRKVLIDRTRVCEKNKIDMDFEDYIDDPSSPQTEQERVLVLESKDPLHRFQLQDHIEKQLNQLQHRLYNVG